MNRLCRVPVDAWKHGLNMVQLCPILRLRRHVWGVSDCGICGAKSRTCQQTYKDYYIAICYSTKTVTGCDRHIPSSVAVGRTRAWLLLAESPVGGLVNMWMCMYFIWDGFAVLQDCKIQAMWAMRAGLFYSLLSEALSPQSLRSQTLVQTPMTLVQDTQCLLHQSNIWTTWRQRALAAHARSQKLGWLRSV